ncbi:(Fe-S)-binding protein [Notoacmeibacter sp. MSK16QG-6]|uniref:(Fe-S)-binding protein n=1 Tax=Notoacmeibacter sp. MSK16QG-6 TaxID=2957982 RepID=UPI00209E99F7|nr:(Fe-S)-binding protein [Notoacmeibacter sp. MSK16QG-6]MCP1200784.1 (Fe-S)-binding protein [Notoacmeibacter sp. MSK16QG-6]
MGAAAYLPWLILAMIVVAVVQVARRILLWRQGQPASVDWLAGLMALPKRYLVDVHHVVDRDKGASRMHVPVAAGLVTACGLSLLSFIPTLGSSPLWWGFIAVAFTAMLAGSFLVALRRYPEKLSRLSAGRYQRMPLFLLAFSGGGALTAGLAAIGNPLPALSLLTLFVAALGGISLALETARGPMRHALAGASHLVAHPRPHRFGPGRDTALRPLDMEGQKFGVETPSDFAWNRLLGFDACVQCGRCEAACPAFAAGQPLSPKHLIADLARAQLRSAGPDYGGAPYPNARPVAGRGGMDQPVIGLGGLIHPDTLWSCTTCRACVEECPMMIEHVDAIVDLRRFQTLERGAVPDKAIEPLDNMRGCDEQNGQLLSARADFAVALGVPVFRDVGEADILLWLGQGAYDLRYQRTLRALIRLLQMADVDFAVLGEEELDCGDLARRLGDEATFQRLASANIEVLSNYRFQRILTADPHALHVLRNEYSPFGGHYEVVHHTAFLSELLEGGHLPAGAVQTAAAVTYHDPCYLGRYNGEFDASRAVLDRIGIERREMTRSGRRAMCCGGGGGAPVTDIPGDTRIPDLRMAQAGDTGAGIVAVACPGCTAMLEGVIGQRPDVRDIAELVLNAVEQGDEERLSANHSRHAVPA